MINLQIEEGCTSSDSCKLEDIIDGVSYLIPDDMRDEFDSACIEDKPYVYMDILDYLDEITPPALYFGSQEGDGTCFFFWKIEEDY